MPNKLITYMFFNLALLLASLTCIAQAGTSWNLQNGVPANSWSSITFGNGTFVAVASTVGSITTTNNVMTCPDGINWTGSAVIGNNWNSVTFGNGMFVAVANDGTANEVMTSRDGITWIIRNTPSGYNWNAVTYGNGMFVAVAYGNTAKNTNLVMTSLDGITWTIRTSAANNSWLSITYGNGQFVAVANSGAGNRVMTSPDGITWTIRTSAANNSWFSITYGNSLFVAVSYDGTGNRVMTSPDGFTWTIRNSAADNFWLGVTYGNGLFVAVAYSGTGTGNRVMTSPDGIIWTIKTSAADYNWYSITYGNGLFVAVNNDGTNTGVMTSGTYGVLPVSLLSFMGKNQGGANQLSWQTATESNSKDFAIESSRTGIDFNKIGTVAAAGNSTITKNYLFTDASPLDGITYYRLKQMDMDGQFTYSATVAINMSKATDHLVSIYPNPASNLLNINAGNSYIGTMAQLYSINGRLVKAIPITKSSHQVNIAALPANTYLLKLEDGTTIKWLKQ